jgi:CRP/FNR family transcriptional regulator, cyclic AMP receptor protein
MAVDAASGPVLRAASLFDIDSELAEHLDVRRREEVRSHAIVPVADLAAGSWSPRALVRATPRSFGLMVLDGLVLRELLLAGSTATELLGPGDIVSVDRPADSLLAVDPVWSVPEAARVAVLDDRLLQILRTWPGVGRQLLERAACREARLFTHRAITQLPRVDQRLLAFFAHLSERWGRVGAQGVVVPLQLTHETLGRLIGARRPTVSLALKDLAADRLLERRNDDGSWLLRYEAFDRLGATAAIPPGWQPADAKRVDEPADSRAPARHRFEAEDIAALRARVERLRSEHASRLGRSATAIERARAGRRVGHDPRGDRRLG